MTKSSTLRYCLAVILLVTYYSTAVFSQVNSLYFPTLEEENNYRLQQYAEQIQQNPKTCYSKEYEAAQRVKIAKQQQSDGTQQRLLDGPFDVQGGYGAGCANDCVFTSPVSCAGTARYRVPVVFTVSNSTPCTNSADDMNPLATVLPTTAEMNAQINIMNDFNVCQGIPIEYYKCTIYPGHPTTGDLSTRVGAYGCTYSAAAVAPVANVLNIYIFHDSGNGSGCNGFAPLPFSTSSSTVVVMARRCFTGYLYTPSSLSCINSNLGLAQVLTHEMGHYFGLYHTHETDVANNNATTNDCDDPNIATDDCTNGDRILDTDEDPDFSGGEIGCTGCDVGTLPQSNCAFNNTLPGCAAYGTPNTLNNIMSYNYFTGCINQFSTCQKAKMMDALLGVRGPQMCCRDVVAELGTESAADLNICVGDPAPTFTAGSACYKWMSGLGPSATQLATGNAFTPALGAGVGQVNNMVPGVYRFYLGDINEYNSNCRTALTVTVSAKPGTPTVNNLASVTQCGSGTVNLATNASVLGDNKVIGWWFTAAPITGITSQASLNTAVAAATIGSPLAYPPNHIIKATTGTPVTQLAQTFDCTGLNGNTYYATPIVASQDVAAPTSFSAALNGQVNISSTVNNLNVPVSQLPATATLTQVCVNISYNACESFATHNDLDLKLQGPNGSMIVLESFFAGSSNVPTPTTFNVCFVDNGTGYTGASSTGCNSGCFTGNLESDNSFSAFDGVNPNGTWTLIVNDDNNASFYPCSISVNLVFDMAPMALVFPSPSYTPCVLGSSVQIACACASCPTLTSAPPTAVVVNSSCGANCTPIAGSIIAPASPCPVGSTYQYSLTNDFASTTTTPPAYGASAMTIFTRCSCDATPATVSPTSQVTTAPAPCVPPTVAPITGMLSVTTCAGATTTLSSTTPGGMWSSASMGVATITAGGVVTGVSVGMSVISYSVTTGTCTTVVMATVTVTACPPSCPTFSAAPPIAVVTNSLCAVGCTTTVGSITVPSSPCPVGSTYQYSLTNDFASTTTTPPAYGTSAITIFTRCSCDATPATVSPTSQVTTAPAPCVPPTVAPITGMLSVTTCAGSTTTLSSTTPGGMWSSASMGVATITAGGVVTGVSVGMSVISYSVTTGTCTTVVMATVTVTACPPSCPTLTTAPPTAVVTNSSCGASCTPVAGSINAPTTPCPVGSTLQYATTSDFSTILATPPAYGASAMTIFTRCSCDATPATVSPTSQVTTAPAPCVLPTVAPITGTLTVTTCAGATTTLSSTTPSGTWSSASMGIATITAGGVVTGVSAGTSVISYAVTSGTCTTTVMATVTVTACPPCPSLSIPAPLASITNSTCTMGGCMLTQGIIAAPTSATCPVGSTLLYSTDGLVSEFLIAPPSYNQNAVQTISTICICNSNPIIQSMSSMVTTNPGVCTPPAVFGIEPMGPVSLTNCIGVTTALTSATIGGVWSSGSPTVASVSTSGVVTGVSAGTSVISYTVTNAISGCATAVTKTVTVTACPCNHLPAAITSCPASGTEDFNCFAGTNGSGIPATNMVNTLPAGWMTSSTDFDPGGFYSNLGGYSGTGSTYALVSSTVANPSTEAAYGVKLGASGAPQTMDYCMLNNSGQTITSFNVSWDVEQYSASQRATTVDFLYSTDNGANYTQNNIVGTNGTNAITNPGTADVNLASVLVTPRAVVINCLNLLDGQQICFRMRISTGAGSDQNAHIGFDNFSFTANCATCPPLTAIAPPVVVTNSSCGSNCTPSAGAIAAPASPCPVGSTIEYSLDNFATAPLTTIPSYNATTPITVYTRCTCECTSSPINSVTTVPVPCTLPVVAPITGNLSITTCSGVTTTLSSLTPGGVWMSSDATVATISPSGVVAGLIAGTSDITYTVTIGTCTTTVMATVTVTACPATCPDLTAPAPAAVIVNSSCALGCLDFPGSISAPTTSCPAGSTLLYSLDGFTTPGTTTIPTYTSSPITVSTRCKCDISPLTDGTITTSLPTAPAPCVIPIVAPIMGTLDLTTCAGSTTTLGSATSGGSWLSESPTVAAVDASSGLVTGVSAGTAVIRYIVGNCSGFVTVTVTACPPVCTHLDPNIQSCGTSSTENFNCYDGSNAAALPAGWTLTTSNTTFGGYNTGTGTANSTFAFGNSTDAAFGAKVAASGGFSNMVYCMTNNTTNTVTSIDVAWDVEQYSESGRATTVDFAYSLDGTTYSLINGTTLTTASVNTTTTVLPPTVTPHAHTISGLNLAPGQQICFRMRIATGTGSGNNAHIGFDNFSVTANCVSCPDLTPAAPVVVVTNSSCGAGCATVAGNIAAPVTSCPVGSTIQYSTDNFATTPLASPPAYGATAMTIYTRCSCDAAPGVTGTVSSVMTVPTPCVPPVVEPITGNLSITTCPGVTTTLSSLTPGGVWMSSNTAVATISTSGVVTGVSAGTSDITYAVTIGNCTTTVMASVTVTICPATCPDLSAAAPAAVIVNSSCAVGCSSVGGSISAPTTTCPVGSTLYYSLDGFATARSTTIPTYTLNAITVSTRCDCDISPFTPSPVSSVTTIPAPCVIPVVAPITGATPLTNCPGGPTATLSSLTSGGTWSCAPTSVATINTSGVVTGVGPGTATVSYTVTLGGCSTTVTTAISVSACPVTPCGDLFFSEYIEGTSNNKYIEIYNPTNAPITLTGNYSIHQFNNGAVTPTAIIPLVGVIPAYGTFIIASNLAALVGVTVNQTSASLNFNGDDAILLLHVTATIDAFGQVGTDPGTNWGSGTSSTVNNTLVRNPAVTFGDIIGNDIFDPNIQWQGLGVDVATNLGSHLSDCACPSLATATLTYTGPFCTSTTSALPAFGGSVGGAYSAPVGLSINSTTGDINPSTSAAGTYIVTYTIAANGPCPAVSISTSVTITQLPSATIAYLGSPFCTSIASGAVTQTGTTGGVYSSTAGLTINAATGAITPSTSTPGAYTVTYTIAAASGCTAVVATAPVTISAPPAPPIAASPQTFCFIPAPTIASLVATGTNIQWYVAASGGAALGTTTPLVSGITYHASQTSLAGCESARVPVTVTINAACFTGNQGTVSSTGTPIGFTPIDPCSCNNNSDPVTQTNGTFNEFIVVTGPSGATLTGAATGGTPSALTFTEVPNIGMPGFSTYTSNIFTHVDNIGYTANLFAGVAPLPAPPFSIGSVSNKCAYPNVVIDPKGPFTNCLGQPSVPLTGTVNPAMTGTFTWGGTNITGSSLNFNPQLPVGNLATNLSFDADFVNNISPDNGITAANPGCIQVAAAGNIVITECCAVNLGVTITKTAGPIQYEECANPDEVISEITILMTNTSGQVLSNVYLNEVITTSAGAFLGLATYPEGMLTNADVIPQLNYNWNGTTNTSLFTNNSGVLGVGDFVEITLRLKFNASLLASSCISNTTSGGGTWMNGGSMCLASSINALCTGSPFPSLVVNPTPLVVNTCTSYNNEIQHWLSHYANALVDHQGRTVEIVCNDYCEPHGWLYADNCSQNARLPVSFTIKYTDGSSFTYCSEIIRVDPQLVNFLELPQNLAVDCSSPNAAVQVQNWLANNGGAIGQLCGGYLFHSNNYNGTLPTGCGSEQLVTFTITNECGLSASAAASITVTDNVPPTFTSVPANITVSCATATPAFGSAIATDACSSVTVTFTDMTTGTSCTGIVSTRRFLATDACGNTAVAIQSITKSADTGAPIFSFVPANTTIACDATPVLGSAIASDACSSVSITVIENTQGFVCSGILLTRVFVATDGCGNATTRTQRITKSPDIAAPVFTFVPANTTIACGGTPANDLATASDACSTVTVTFEDSDGGSPSCAGAGITRTFTATDGCDNTTTAVQLFTPNGDVEPPTFAPVPEQLEIMCGDAIIFSTPSAMDNCGALTITHMDEVNGDVCAGIMNIREWTATDACGNTSTMKQTVWQLGDYVDPEFTNLLEDERVYFCGETPNYDGVGAVDNCGGSVTVSYEIDYDYEDYCYDGYGYYSKVRYLAVDACGNENHETITSHFVPLDHRMAFMYKPANKTVSCSDGYTFDAVHPKVVSYDGIISSVIYSDLANLTPCGSGTITRRWTATDVVGNTAIAEQTVTILPDTELPTLVLANNSILIDCAAAIPIEEPLVTDNCSDIDAIMVTYTDETIENTVERTWSAQDACGNVASATQIFIILDTQAPVFATALQDKTISCDAPLVFDIALAIDACSAVTMSFTDTHVSINCGIEHTRTWKATDALGHEATAIQKITVLDNTAPVFSYVPDDQVVASASMVSFGTPQVADNCQSVQLSSTDAQTAPICGNTGYTVTRTWVANDGCDNQAIATQQISIDLDVEAPTFATQLTNITVTCGGLIVFDTPIATDNSGGAVELTFTDAQTTPICGYTGYTMTRTWNAKDACDNVTVMSQTIEVPLDITPPVFTFVPADEVVATANLINFGTPQTSDDCNTVQFTYTDVQTAPICGNTGYTITRTWLASDGCDNVAYAEQKISVGIDVTAPVFDTALTEKVINCGGDMEFDVPSVSDNSGSLELTFTDDQTAPTCGNSGYTLTRTWTAHDACNNESVMIQHLIVLEDTEAPVFVGSVFDLEMAQLAFNNWVPTPLAAYDNCQTVEVVTGTPIQKDECNYQIDYTATDACGNFVIRTQNIHISDCLVLVTDEGVLSSVLVYPNPVHDQLTIILPNSVQPSEVIAEVFDALGRIVIMSQVVQHQHQLDVEKLATGNYVLRLSTNGNTKAVKFVKM